MKKQLLSGIITTVAAATMLPMSAFAHVVVKPAEVNIGAFQTFTTGVPNERDTAVVGLRLVIPAGLNFVSPNVKPGWTVTEKKTGTGDNVKVTEIDWSDGSIPVGERDDFVFSAQAPAKAGEVDWKAYQTYADGTVISWDQKPVANAGDDDSSTKGPYSITKVINDLTSTASSTNSSDNSVPIALSIVAIALAAGSIILVIRKRR